MSIRKIDELNLEHKRVFIRVDFNVPISGGKVSDTTRIDAALPTIRYALEHRARVILASHLGRPKGKVNPEYSMIPVGQVLGEKLGVEVLVPDYPVGDAAFKLSRDVKAGSQVVLLENLRFDPGETAGDESFAEKLAELADVYVNDAFGTAHRSHASTYTMVKHFEERGAGFLLAREVEFFEKLLTSPPRPFVGILGGAKVSDKIGVIRNLLGLVDKLVIGGAMANTFLAARGVPMGASKVEEERFALCRELLDIADKKGVEILLPVDLLASDSVSATSYETVEEVPAGMMALDIGPATRELFAKALEGSGAVFWNGPMGVFENPVFAEGTLAVGRAVAAHAGMSVVGGGDSAAAVKKLGLADSISHISTGGGASLAMMEGSPLPGVVALMD